MSNKRNVRLTQKAFKCNGVDEGILRVRADAGGEPQREITAQ